MNYTTDDLKKKCYHIVKDKKTYFIVYIYFIFTRRTFLEFHLGINGIWEICGFISLDGIFKYVRLSELSHYTMKYNKKH